MKHAMQPLNPNRPSSALHNQVPLRPTVVQPHFIDVSSKLRRHSLVAQKSKQLNYSPSIDRSSSRDLKGARQRGTSQQPHNAYEAGHGLPINKSRLLKPDGSHLQRSGYRFVNMVGKGGFGKVWKVQLKETQRFYALKEISKAIVVAKRSVDSVLNERQLLSLCRHRFLVNMHSAFQDADNLYIAMDLMEGGDLRYHFCKMVKFTEMETRFIAASIILALQYLHNNMIIHRDVKPENIVFDLEGYAYLTDLGIAKYLRHNNSDDTSGTPGYMAPEVMFHHSHGFQVDFYALGVILYQIMIGVRPYLGRSRDQVKEKIKDKQVFIAKKDIPDGWSVEAADFINKLLQRKPVKRLGWGGAQQLKSHLWFRNFPWDRLLEGSGPAPVRRCYNHAQVRYKQTEPNIQYEKVVERNRAMLKKGIMQEHFRGYTYEDDPSSEQTTRV